MQYTLVLATLLGLSLNAVQSQSQLTEIPKYLPLSQDKIIELYEFLRTELKGEDGEVYQIVESLRKKRNAEASLFFLHYLFGRRDYDYGYDSHDNRGYRSHGRRKLYH